MIGLFLSTTAALIVTSFTPDMYPLCSLEVAENEIKYIEGFNVPLNVQNGLYCLVVPGLNYRQVENCFGGVDDPFTYDGKSYGRQLFGTIFRPCLAGAVAVENKVEQDTILDSQTISTADSSFTADGSESITTSMTDEATKASITLTELPASQPNVELPSTFTDEFTSTTKSDVHSTVATEKNTQIAPEVEVSTASSDGFFSSTSTNEFPAATTGSGAPIPQSDYSLAPLTPNPIISTAVAPSTSFFPVTSSLQPPIEATTEITTTAYFSASVNFTPLSGTPDVNLPPTPTLDVTTVQVLTGPTESASGITVPASVTSNVDGTVTVDENKPVILTVVEAAETILTEIPIISVIVTDSIYTELVVVSSSTEDSSPTSSEGGEEISYVDPETDPDSALADVQGGSPAILIPSVVVGVVGVLIFVVPLTLALVMKRAGRRRSSLLSESGTVTYMPRSEQDRDSIGEQKIISLIWTKQVLINNFLSD